MFTYRIEFKTTIISMERGTVYHLVPHSIKSEDILKLEGAISAKVVPYRAESS